MKQVSVEISELFYSNGFYNYSPGVYCKCLYEKDVTEIIDFYGNSASITFQFSNYQTITSVKVEKISYDMASSLEDCKQIEGSFYFDYSTQFFYVHFINNSRQLNKEMLVGAVFGYSKQNNTVTDNVYQSSYYDPRVMSFPNIKKEISGNFYGRIKYPSANIKFNNLDGHFDEWREKNLYNTSARLMFAEDPTSYSDFSQIYSGFIADDSSSWDSFEVDLADERKKLEQPVATNLINLTEFPSAPEGSIDKPKPVVYGKVIYRKCICVDDSATAKFIFADTLYNPVESLEGVYIDEVAQSPSNISLLDGTFELATTDVDNVYASFTMPTKNGVSIIIDLIKNYDNKNFLPTYYDKTQTLRAQGTCRNTSIYVDKDTKLKDKIGRAHV